MLDVDTLAQEIRRVDGSNSLGAGALPNGDPILGECSLMEDIDLYRHLGMVDGIDCTNQYGRKAI